MASFLPHGPVTLAAVLFAATAYGFSLFAAFGNKTFKLEFDDNNRNVANDRLGTIRFGYFGYCALGVCQDYKSGGEAFIDNYTDAYVLTGFSAAIIMATLGGIYMLFLLMAMCIPMKRWILVTMGLVFGLCLSLPLLSLLVSGIGYGSPDCFSEFDDDLFMSTNFTWYTNATSFEQIYYCRPDIGSILAFAASFLWIVALSMTCCCMTVDSPHRDHDLQHPNAEDAAAYSTYTHTPSKNGDDPSYAASTGLEDDLKSASP